MPHTYIPSSSLCNIISKSMPRTLVSLCFTMIKPQPSLPHYQPTASSDHHAQGDSDCEPSPDPDFATAYTSERFFFSSPGRSNSILNSSSINSSTSCTTVQNDRITDGTIAVHTYSPDPFMDFRQSMQEMVEAREVHDVQQDWDYLQELLMCYLSLNKESTHKFIIGAFGDLLVSLMTSHPQLDKVQNKHDNDAERSLSKYGKLVHSICNVGHV